MVATVWERDSATIHAVLTTVEVVLKCGLTLFHWAGRCAAHTACRRRCSVRLERGFGGKPCHACRLRKYVQHASEWF